MKTPENNKLIAEFMGGYTIEGFENIVNFDETNNILSNECLNLKDLKFHSSWDWLMIVIEKITTLEEFQDYEDNSIFWDEFCSLSIKGVYSQCVGFIKWYNSTTTLANGK